MQGAAPVPLVAGVGHGTEVLYYMAPDHSR